MADVQDAVALLKADHRTVDELFKKFEDATRKDEKQRIADKICLELTVHAQIEEEIFYPACKGEVDEDLLKESYVEHDGAKVLIAEIEAGSPADEFFDAKVKVLSEQIKHHVGEEEGWLNGMFAQARRHGLDMQDLGAKLSARKTELVKQYKKSLPAPTTATLSRTKLAGTKAA